MFYYLSGQILDWSHGTAWESRLSWLRLFHYITVRSAGAAITALVLSWWLGPKIIHWLKTLKFGQDYKDRAEEAGGLAARVLSKRGTPTMGGVLIVTVLAFTTMLSAEWNAQVELTLLCILVLAGTRILPRLRENRPAKRRRHSAARQAAGADRARFVRGHLSLAASGDERTASGRKQKCHPQQSGQRPDAAVLQISVWPSARWSAC